MFIVVLHFQKNACALNFLFRIDPKFVSSYANECLHELALKDSSIILQRRYNGESIQFQIEIGNINDVFFRYFCKFFLKSKLTFLGIGGMNRRTADVFSPGYATLFKLDKEDLEEVVKEYPEAQIALQKKADEVMREKKEGTGGGGSNGKQGDTNSQDPKNRDQKEGKEQNDKTKVNDEQEDTGHKECNVTKSKKEQRKVNNQETFDNQWPNRTDSNLFNKNLEENENTGMEHKIGNEISTPKIKRRSFTLPEFEIHKSPENVSKGFNSNAELFKFTNSNIPIEVKRYKESNVEHGFNPLHELQSVEAKDAGPHSTVHNFGEKGTEVPHDDKVVIG